MEGSRAAGKGLGMGRDIERIGMKLSNAGYRNAISKAHFDVRIPAQIRQMREALGWTQQELAGKLNTTQSAISRLESTDDKDISMKTLFKLAEVFDTAMFVSFVSFPKFLQETQDLSAEILTVKPFEEGN